jgi:hypothetical protein
MSGKQTRQDELLASYSEHVLDCLYDDGENPSNVTVLPGGQDEQSTDEWITADIASVVPLEDAR